nr:sigma-70 family RNA polymerase sigma factor [Streptomyces sp. PR69]
MAAQSGDQSARDRLAAESLPLVYNIVGRALHGHADADDVTQETMLRALDSLGGLRDPGRFRSWLVAIAMNQMRGHWRQRGAGAVAALDEIHDLPDPRADFVDVTIARLGLSGQRREVAEATRWLDSEDRALLSLWWLEAAGEVTRAEVAAALELTPQHTAVRVQRMKAQLEVGRVVVRALAAEPRCVLLEPLTEQWDGIPSALWRKRIARHARQCTVCSGHSSGLIPAERLLAGLALTPLSAALALRWGVGAQPSADPVAYAEPAAASTAPAYDAERAVSSADPADPADPAATAAHAAPAVAARRGGRHGGRARTRQEARQGRRARRRTAVALAAVLIAGGGGGAFLLLPDDEDKDRATASPTADADAGLVLPHTASTAPVSPSVSPSLSPSPSSSPPTPSASTAPSKSSAAPKKSEQPAPTPPRTAAPRPPAASRPAPPAAPQGFVAEVTDLVNAERAKEGCGPVSGNAQLHEAALNHSEDMAARDYFDHSSPEGTGPGERITAAGYRWSTYGENIARGQQSAAKVMESWMNSPGHRANILNCSFKEIGVGVHEAQGGPWWTQVFGARG